MLIFLVLLLVDEVLAASVTIDGCDVSVTSMGKEYCVHCSDSSKLPTPDGTACALSCGTNEGIKDCTKCGESKCSTCTTSKSTTQVPTSDGLKCVPRCNNTRQTGIENCKTCTAPLKPFQCTECNTPYTLSSDKKSCVLICNGVQIDKCQECNTDASTCKTCQPGYTHSADGKFCYRTCGSNGPIQYCAGCREQTCTACNSFAYLKGNQCILRKGLEEVCSIDDPCHVSLQCLYSGFGLNNGSRKCFPASCAPGSSDPGVGSVCNGQGTCTGTSFNLDSQTSTGVCSCLSTDISSNNKCGACVNSTFLPSYDVVGTCVPKQGPYERCSSSLPCQPGLSCYSNYQCIPESCLSGILTKSICNNAGSCGEASFDSSSNKWTATCVCFDPLRVPGDKCNKCTTGDPVGITCANSNCVESKVVCSGYGSCKEDGQGCNCDTGFESVTVSSKHRCYPSTCGGTPSDSQTYCNNKLGTCLQQLDSSFLCACPAGYRGVETRATTKSTSEFGGCVPWSCYPMLNGSICGPFNGGTCNTITTGTYECSCHSGFKLTAKGCLPEKCGPEANGSVCLSKGICERNSGVWACSCLDGYQMTDMGCFNHRCKATSAGIPCSGHGLCQDNTKCKCSAGYAGPACSITTVALSMAITIPILVLFVGGVLTYILVKKCIAKREQAKLMNKMFPIIIRKKK